jgi:hypothetical protein
MQQPLTKKLGSSGLSSPVLAQVFVRGPNGTAERLPRQVQRILGFFDGRRNVEQVLAEAQISVERGVAVVKKLSREGVIAPSRPVVKGVEWEDTLLDMTPPPLDQEAPFSAEEEAFFASEVQPDDDEPPALRERVSLLVSDLLLRMLGSAA